MFYSASFIRVSLNQKSHNKVHNIFLQESAMPTLTYLNDLSSQSLIIQTMFSKSSGFKIWNFLCVCVRVNNKTSLRYFGATGSHRVST